VSVLAIHIHTPLFALILSRVGPAIGKPAAYLKRSEVGFYIYQVPARIV